MITKTITYENFNGLQVTEDCYFNMSKSELMDLEMESNGAFSARLKALSEAEGDGKEILKLVKEFILMGYGQKSEDGRRFIKSDELSEEFSQTGAFQELYMTLATDATAMSSFIEGMMPSDLMAEAMDMVNKERAAKALPEPIVSQKPKEDKIVNENVYPTEVETIPPSTGRDRRKSNR